MKWLKLIVSLTLILGAFVFFAFIQKSQKTLKVTQQTPVKMKEQKGAKLYFEFLQEPGEWLARSGSIIIEKKEVESLKKFRLLEHKGQKILASLFYLQHVSYAKKKPQKITYHFPLQFSEFKSLLNQYGIAYEPSVEVEFQANPKKGRQVLLDNKILSLDDVNRDHYLWGAYQTEKFEFYLSEIDKKLKNQKLFEEATRLQLSIQEYRDQYIDLNMQQSITPERLGQVSQKRGLASTPQGKAQAKKILIEKIRKKNLDYFSEKYLLDLPIQVNLKPPQFMVDLNHESVPYFGPKNSQLSVAIFSDSTSPSSNQLMSEIYKIANKYQGLHMEYRPILSGGNIFQELREKINSCVWEEFPDSYWEYQVDAQGFYNERTQEKLLSVVRAKGLDDKTIEKCLHSKRAQQVVDYHKKYASYLGIHSGPVVFVGGEVLIPPVNIQKIEKLINRQLGFADSAVW